MGRVSLCWLVGVAATFSVATAESPAGPRPATVLHEHPSIRYASNTPTDRVARLNQALGKGAPALPRDAQTGYLRPLLDALGVSTESQLLVFSKTGVQSAYTSPSNPRAIFFDDAIAVGYVAGAPSLEVAAHDPQQGVIFYTVNQTAAAFTPTRRTTCLACHVSDSTLGVPGMIVRSNAVAADGRVMAVPAGHMVTHETPHSDRWGGWYVTSGGAPPPYTQTEHSGNITFSPARGASTRTFVEWFNSAPEKRGYLSALSESAALLVFDHQVQATNLLTRLSWQARIATSAGREPDRDRTVRQYVNELVDYLLFIREAHFPIPIYSRAAFASQLESRYPKDRRGRSLARLDLVTRLLRYPCSYMVYSEAFDALPPSVRQAVYARMVEIISGRVAASPYPHPDDDRRAVLEILAETKAGFPQD